METIIEFRQHRIDWWELKVHINYQGRLISFGEENGSTKESLNEKALDFCKDYLSKNINFKVVVNSKDESNLPG